MAGRNGYVRQILRKIEKHETLAGVDLRNLYLSGMDLSNLDLRGANLKGCRLSNGKLAASDLANADLTDTMLINTSFKKANLVGTENVASIIGMGKAAELASIYLEEENTRVRQLRERLETGIVEQIPGTRINGNRNERIPNTTNIRFSGCEAGKLLKGLETHGCMLPLARPAPGDSIRPMFFWPWDLLSRRRFPRSDLGSVVTILRARLTMS